MKEKFARNTIYMYIVTAVKMVFPLITLPYLTRVLSVNAYGAVTYVKTFMSYIQLVLDFGFLLSATKDIALSIDDKVKIGKIVGDTIVEKMILTLSVVIVTFISITLIPILNENKLFVWLYLLACCVTIFIPDFLYRGIEKMEYVAIPYASAKIIVIILTFIMVQNDDDIIYIGILEIIGNIVAAGISLWYIKKLEIRVSTSCKLKWVRDLKDSGIYFVSNFATTFLGAMTTMLVGICLNVSQVAFWGLCMQIVSAAKAMYTPITNSLYPHMVVKKDIKLINKIGFLMGVPIAMGCILVIVAGESLMVIIGGVEYGYAGYVLKFLLPVFVFSFYSMLYGWPVLGAMGKVKETTMSTVIAAVIQTIGMALLLYTNKLDLISLAICCCISETVLFAIRYYIYKRMTSV